MSQIELAPANDADAVGDTLASAQAMADQFDALCAAAGFARDLIRASWNATAHGVTIADWPGEIERLAYHWGLVESRDPTEAEIAAGFCAADDAISEFVKPFGFAVDELDAAETCAIEELGGITA